MAEASDVRWPVTGGVGLSILARLVWAWWPRPTESPMCRGDRLAHALLRLGPSFVKLGQFLSTREDLLPREVRERLAQLQDHLPPVPAQDISAVIHQETGQNPEQAFASFEAEPLAVASIGQAHRAVLHDGRRVVVKVRRPDVARQMIRDVERIRALGRWLQRLPKSQAGRRLAPFLEEFGQALLLELDFRHELRNLRDFRRALASYPEFVLPEPIDSLSGERVLTATEIVGCKIVGRQQLIEDGLDPDVVVERLSRLMLESALIVGIFHADPHPGNLAALPGNRIALLDFGQVGRLNTWLRRETLRLMLSMRSKNARAVVVSLEHLGMIQRVDPHLQRDIEGYLHEYLDRPVGQWNIGRALAELFQLCQSYDVALPRAYAMLTKSFLILEGVLRRCAPEGTLLEFSSPLQQRLTQAYLGLEGRAVGERMFDTLLEVQEMPGHLGAIVANLAQGRTRFTFDLSVDGAERDLLERWIGRVVFALVFGALMLSVALVLALVPYHRTFLERSLHDGFLVLVIFAVYFLVHILRRSKI